MRRALFVAAFLGIAIVPVVALAASFDCKNATTAIEKLICSDSALSALDTKLADAYRRALSVAEHTETIKSAQHAWLSAERAKCSDIPCLREVYQRRLVALEHAVDAGFTALDGHETSYSFANAPFVNPRIVDDLSTGESDHGDQVIAVNVSDAQRSNRYFVSPEVRRQSGQYPYVFYRNDAEEFGYRFVGRTTSGVDVLLTGSSGGGSGVFENLILVTLRLEAGGMTPELVLDSQTISFKRRRLVLKKLGEIGLGDRWQAEVKVQGNEIVIGKNRAPLPGDDAGADRIIKVDFP